jgi:hypothetical protein
VISDGFEGKTVVDRNTDVMDVIIDETDFLPQMKLLTYTCDEWAKMNVEEKALLDSKFFSETA